MRTRFSGLVAAVLAAGCAGGDGGGTAAEPWSSTGDSDPDGKIIKVSYVRFIAEQDAKTHQTRFVHNYRFMLSQGWTNRRGPRAKEPFEKLWRDSFRAESVPDRVMEELVRRMNAAGLNELKDTSLDRIDLETLRRLDRSDDLKTATRMRIITVETDRGRKTVTYYDNDDSRAGTMGPLTKRFLAVEQEMLKVMAQYTIQVSVETDSTMPRDREKR